MQSCSDDTASVKDDNQTNVTPEPDKDKTPSENPVVIEQHFWNQDKSEDVVVSDTKTVSKVEDAVSIIETIEEPTNIVIAQDFSALEEVQVVEKLNEVAKVLVSNPEKAKKTVLDLSDTKLRKITAETFRAQLGLSKAGGNNPIYMLRMILPSTLEEIADGALSNFVGTEFIVTSAGISVGQNVASQDQGISFTVYPEVLQESPQLISVLGEYGNVRLAWDMVLGNGFTISNNTPSSKYIFPDSVNYDYLILDFVKNSNHVLVYKGYTKADGTAQLLLASDTQYHIQNAGSLSANILIDWNNGLDGKLFAYSDSLHSDMFADDFDGMYGAIFNTARWGSGVSISGSQNPYSPFVECSGFDASRYESISAESQFAKVADHGNKLSLSDMVKNVIDNPSYVEAGNYVFSFFDKGVFFREKSRYDSIQASYISASDYSKITLTYNNYQLGTLYPYANEASVSFNFEPSEYCLRIRDIQKAIDSYAEVASTSKDYLMRFVGNNTISLKRAGNPYDSIMVSYAAYQDYSRLSLSLNGQSFGTITPLANGSKVEYRLDPSDYLIRYYDINDAISSHGTRTTVDGNYVIRFLSDKYISYLKSDNIYDSVIVAYTTNSDLSKITMAEAQASIGVGVSGGKATYALKESKNYLENIVNNHGYIEADGFAFSIFKDEAFVRPVSEYDSILMTCTPASDYSSLAIKYNGNLYGTITAQDNNGKVVYGFEPSGYFYRYNDVNNAIKGKEERTSADNLYLIRFLSDEYISYKKASNIYDSIFVAYSINTDYSKIVFTDSDANVTIGVKDQKVEYKMNNEAKLD